MPTVWKQVLAPDDYRVRGRWVRFTPEDIRHYAVQGKRMIAEGVPIRIPLEHLEFATPFPAEEQEAKDALFNKGFVEDFKIDRDGSLWAAMDVPDKKLAKRLATEIKFVSPRIDPVIEDGAGNVWKNVVTHVALTAKPVAHKQKPFGVDPIGLRDPDMMRDGAGDFVAMSQVLLRAPLMLSMAESRKVLMSSGDDSIDFGEAHNRFGRLMGPTRKFGGKIHTAMRHPGYDDEDHARHHEFHRMLAAYHKHVSGKSADSGFGDPEAHIKASAYHLTRANHHKAMMTPSKKPATSLSREDRPMAAKPTKTKKARHWSDDDEPAIETPSPRQPISAVNRERPLSRYVAMSATGEWESILEGPGVDHEEEMAKYLDSMKPGYKVEIESGDGTKLVAHVLGKNESPGEVGGDEGIVHYKTEAGEHGWVNRKGKLSTGSKVTRMRATGAPTAIAMAMDDEDAGAGDDSGSYYARARKLLAEHDPPIFIADDVPEEDAWKHLCTALEALDKRHGDVDDSDVDDDEDLDDTDDDLEPDDDDDEEDDILHDKANTKAREEPMSVAMSQEKVSKQVVEMSQRLRASEQQNKRLVSKLADQELDSIDRRIGKCVQAGVMTKEIGRKILQAVSAKKLSLVNGDEDKSVIKAMAKLEMAEEQIEAGLTIGDDLLAEKTGAYQMSQPRVPDLPNYTSRYGWDKDQSTQAVNAAASQQEAVNELVAMANGYTQQKK